MTEVSPKDQATQQKLREPNVATENAGKSDYSVGRCRPPLHTRWKPGQSGNPTGRRKGRPNAKTMLDRVLNQKVTVRQGQKSREMPLLEAMIHCHATQGAKGDARSANLILGMLQKAGAWGDHEFDASIEKRGHQQNGVVPLCPANKTRPSDWLLEHINPDLLFREEMIELSRLAEIIDLGGDITAIGAADFERVKHIVNKGRGKDITPQ